MRTITSLNDAIFEAEKRWSLSFRVKTRDEACSRCPWCGGHDRFLIFHTGYYMCRAGDGHCAKTGWILEEEQESRLSAVELRVLALEREAANAKREREDLERRVEKLEEMRQSTDHLAYFNNVRRDYWHSEGISDESIKRWMLGYCSRCRMDYQKRPSHTIPVVNIGKLRNIRHRIIGAKGSDKYRPQMTGLGNTLFYADALFKLDKSMVVLWEGEKKAIVGAQNGFDGPGVMGIQGFQEEWAKWFMPFKRVYVCYDPDATKKAAQDAGLFKGRGRVVELPMKADDFFKYGTSRDFCEYLRRAKAA